MFGDAVDFNNNSGTQAEWDNMNNTALTAGADWREQQTDSGLGHVHADWRDHNPYAYAH